MPSTAELLPILRVGHETSGRGSGISLRRAICAARYRELRAAFGPEDLLPLIRGDRTLVEQWLAYSEDKRTCGGWYILADGAVGQVDSAGPPFRFSSVEEAVAEYVVRELDYWDGVADAG